MKKLIGFLFLLHLYIGVVFGQSNLIISPKNPQPEQEVTFSYTPTGTPLDSSLVISATVNLFEKTGRFRKPIDLILKYEGDQWIGKFKINYGCVSYLIIFKDENDLHDNYDGHGYRYILKDNDGEELIGGKAAIAKYCFINTNYVPYVFEPWLASCNPDLERGRKMLEEEFTKNEELTAYYISTYSNSINLGNPEEKNALLEKTDWLFEQRELLDSRSLRDLSGIYMDIGDNEKLLACRKTNMKIHPNSNWAFQVGSIHLQRKILEASTLNEKLHAYKKLEKYFDKGLKEKIDSSPQTLERTLSMDNIFQDYPLSLTWINKYTYAELEKSVRLMGLLTLFIEEGSLAKWLKMVEEIDDEWYKLRVYEYYAKHQVKESKNNVEDTLSLALITKAIKLSTNKLDSPRDFRELMFSDLSDNDIRRKREIDVAEYWMTKAQLLLKIGKEQEAIFACNKAIEYGKFANTIYNLNNRIVDFLLIIGDEKAAKEVAKLTIEKGTATDMIKKLLNEEDAPQIDSLEAGLVKNKKEYLEGLMMNTPAQSFELKNLKGEKISLEDLKNKVVVLDFWATWCAPCLMTFPAYKELIEKYKTEPDVEFLFICLDKGKNEKEISQFLQKRGFAFNVMLDEKGESAKTYKVGSLPTKFVISPEGKINFRNSGGNGDKDQIIEELSLMIEIAKKSSTY
ncbi:redoxin domain-containing protein [Chondrinema litorale]|uniref:redoxin domain-containing protein n=1 Tax=Chondrinema litorale TaxID=2994555 RepID=UPI002543289F|nr:redoxin domain-containing protein [Chondrinema litorale]UZR96868.1 redoxin domain-containing protein [Chondrinema litorale]